jgi:hypothetical protein
MNCGENLEDISERNKNPSESTIDVKAEEVN